MRSSTLLCILAVFILSTEAQFPRIPEFVKNKIAQKVKETLNSKCETEDLCGDGLSGTFRKMEDSDSDCSEFVEKTVPDPKAPEINLEKGCEKVSTLTAEKDLTIIKQFSK